MINLSVTKNTYSSNFALQLDRPIENNQYLLYEYNNISDLPHN